MTPEQARAKAAAVVEKMYEGEKTPDDLVEAIAAALLEAVAETEKRWSGLLQDERSRTDQLSVDKADLMDRLEAERQRGERLAAAATDLIGRLPESMWRDENRLRLALAAYEEASQ